MDKLLSDMGDLFSVVRSLVCTGTLLSVQHSHRSLFRLFSGQQTSSAGPSYSLCVIQAALIYGAPILYVPPYDVVLPSECRRFQDGILKSGSCYTSEPAIAFLITPT